MNDVFDTLVATRALDLKILCISYFEHFCKTHFSYDAVQNRSVHVRTKSVIHFCRMSIYAAISPESFPIRSADAVDGFLWISFEESRVVRNFIWYRLACVRMECEQFWCPTLCIWIVSFHFAEGVDLGLLPNTCSVSLSVFWIRLSIRWEKFANVHSNVICLKYVPCFAIFAWFHILKIWSSVGNNTCC